MNCRGFRTDLSVTLTGKDLIAQRRQCARSAAGKGAADVCPSMPCLHECQVSNLRRRFEQQLVTNWRQVQINAAWQRLYFQTDEAMQVGTQFPWQVHTIMQPCSGTMHRICVNACRAAPGQCSCLHVSVQPGWSDISQHLTRRCMPLISIPEHIYSG